jgi:serine/threonine protein kinase
MTYYEVSLLDYIRKMELNSSKICGIMQKMVEILSQIHGQYVLHRDLKPANFMIKNGDLFLIDFGLATFFITESGTHVPNEISESLVGSPKYMSFHLFSGNRYSRRDDMISLGYICIMMFLKETPWEQLMSVGETEYDEIDIRHPKNKIRWENRILSTFLERYCVGINENIAEYLRYVYELEYDEKPKYEYLLELLSDIP